MWRYELHPPHLISVLLHYLVKVEKPKMHVNTTSAFNVNYKIAVTCINLHRQFHKMFWWIILMNIQVRACVQSVHHQHAHMISDGHASIDDVPVKVGMHGIKKCPTIIYRLKKYRDTGIPRYFVTSSIVDNFCKNPTVRIIYSAVNDSLCHIC